MTKITIDTVLTTEAKNALFEEKTKGMKETYKARYSAVFFDSRTFAMQDDALGLIEGSKDMLDIVSQNPSIKHAFTPAINDAIELMKIDTSRIFAAGAPMKAIKRFIQFVGAVYHKDFESFDTTSAIILLALDLAGDKPLTNDALFYLGTGQVKNAGMSPNTRGVARSIITEKLDSVYKNTMKTQISRSVGKAGFLTVCGAVNTHGKGKDVSYTLNTKHPLTIAFLELMGRATEGQIDAMLTKGKRK